MAKQLTQEDINELMYMHDGNEIDLHMLENGAEAVAIFDSIDEFLNSEILEEIHEDNRRDSIYEDEMDDLAFNELDHNQKMRVSRIEFNGDHTIQLKSGKVAIWI